MPAYNFQERFAADVESGKKRTTIRRLRKSGNATPGSTLYLFVNQRRHNCRRLGQHTCLSVTGISLNWDVCTLDGKPVDSPTLRQIALEDGFSDTQAFLKFFEYQHGLPFDGVLIKW